MFPQYSNRCLDSKMVSRILVRGRFTATHKKVDLLVSHAETQASTETPTIAPKPKDTKAAKSQLKLHEYQLNFGSFPPFSAASRRLSSRCLAKKQAYAGAYQAKHKQSDREQSPTGWRTVSSKVACHCEY